MATAHSRACSNFGTLECMEGDSLHPGLPADLARLTTRNGHIIAGYQYGMRHILVRCVPDLDGDEWELRDEWIDPTPEKPYVAPDVPRQRIIKAQPRLQGAA